MYEVRVMGKIALFDVLLKARVTKINVDWKIHLFRNIASLKTFHAFFNVINMWSFLFYQY